MSWYGGVMQGNNLALDYEFVFPDSQTLFLIATTDAAVDSSNTYIDWGDGSDYQAYDDAVSSDLIMHAYTAGTYRFRVFDLAFDIAGRTGSHNIGNLNISNSMAGTDHSTRFNSFGFVRNPNTLPGIGTSSTTPLSIIVNRPLLPMYFESNLGAVFRSLTNLDLGTDPVNWFFDYMINPTVMNQMFYGCTKFNSDVAYIDPGKSTATTLSAMFRDCTNFDNGGSDSIDNWDVSDIISFSNIFYNATSFNRDISSWDFSGFIGSINNGFRNASSFDQDISAWFTNGGGMAIDSGSNTKLREKKFKEMLRDSGMSVENYSRFLIGAANWAKDNSITGIKLGASGLQYNDTTYSGIGTGFYDDAVSARLYLTGTANFTVSDSGEV